MSASVSSDGVVTITVETLWRKNPAEGDPCTINDDCFRCSGGSNEGAPCLTGADCFDGGQCALGGSCVSGTCQAQFGAFPLGGLTRNALIQNVFPSGLQILAADRTVLQSTSVFGGTLPNPDIVGTTIAVDTSDPFFDIRRQQFSYSLPGLGLGNGQYIVYWVDAGRIEGLHNVTGTLFPPYPTPFAPFSLECRILFDGTPRGTPTITSRVLTTVAKGQLYSNNLNASGDSGLSYDFIVGSSDPRWGPTTQVPGLTVNSSGQVEIPSTSTSLLNDTNLAGEPGGDYVFKVVITDADGQYVEQDVMLDVIATPNQLCSIDASDLSPTVSVGDTLVLTITATDPDSLNSLTITAFPSVSGATLTQAGSNPRVGTYTFIPTAGQADSVIGVNFSAIDDHAQPLTCVVNVQIQVLPLDCDNDTISDADEIANCTGDPRCADCNNNLIPDGCDIDDCPGDPACADCNANSIPDGCEPDCNLNSVADECDIASGQSQDCQPDGVPDSCQLSGLEDRTQSLSTSIVDQVACGVTGGNCTLPNWWARCFPISGSTTIAAVQFGVFQATGPPPSGTWQIDVNLWADNDGTCPPSGPSTATLLGQSMVTVGVPQQGQLVTAVFSPPVVVPPGTALVAEVGTSTDGCAFGAGILFRSGANSVGQTGPSYFLAPDCGFFDWTDHATFGFGNLHTVMVLKAVEPDGNDENQNGIPDECDLQAPMGVGPGKIRVVSFSMPALEGTVAGPGTNTAIRLTLLNLPGAYGAWSGRKMWVGPPQDVCEAGGTGPGQACPPGFSFSKFAKAQCTQHCRSDWGTLGTIHLWGEGVIGGAIYRLQAISCADDPDDENRYSDPLNAATPKWGDCCGPFQGGWTGPDGDVDVTTDVVAVLDKFSNRPTAPIKARADVIGDVDPRVNLDLKINITDVSRVLDAFRSLPYPFSPSAATPCN